MIDSIKIIQSWGMEVMGGFIVGFDSDREDIFKRQFELIQNSGVVTAMVGVLTALPQTKLYQRLLIEGRLEAESTGDNTATFLNFKPKMDKESLLNGYKNLMQKLYEPEIYYKRIQTFFHHYKTSGDQLSISFKDFLSLLKSSWILGMWNRGRLQYWKLLLKTMIRRPREIPCAIALAITGHHFRLVANRL